LLSLSCFRVSDHFPDKMFSAPAVLVEPKDMILAEESLMTQDCFEWAIPTPEPSPICLLKAPSCSSDELLCSFERACSPVWQQMLNRIASQASLVGVVDPSARHQLVQALCQPFFEQAVELVCGKISSAGESDATRETTRECPYKDDRIILNLGRGLGFLEEDSTDADSDAAFSALLSSEGEYYEVEQKLDLESSEAPTDVGKSEMVCRHWKSKGWCRYESLCKFSHPENKRGMCAKALAQSDNDSLQKISTKRRGGNKRDRLPLDSRLLLAESYNSRQPCAYLAALFP